MKQRIINVSFILCVLLLLLVPSALAAYDGGGSGTNVPVYLVAYDGGGSGT